MKHNFLIVEANGKNEIIFSESADELLELYKESNGNATLYIRPIHSKRKRSGNAEIAKPEKVAKPKK